MESAIFPQGKIFMVSFYICFFFFGCHGFPKAFSSLCACISASVYNPACQANSANSIPRVSDNFLITPYAGCLCPFQNTVFPLVIDYQMDFRLKDTRLSHFLFLQFCKAFIIWDCNSLFPFRNNAFVSI